MGYSPLLKEARAGLEAGTWREDVKQRLEGAAAGFMPWSACFLMEPTASCPGRYRLQWTRPSHVNRQLRRCPKTYTQAH